MDSTEITKLKHALKSHPNRIPIIIMTTPNFSRYFKLIKHKYLVMGQTTVGYFMFQLKRINNIKTDQAIYMYHFDTLLNSSDTFENLKNKYVSDKEITLMIKVDCENAFG